MATDAAVIDEVVRAARTQSPEVARLPEAETRRHVALVLPVVLARDGDPAAAARLGADRAAQGVPITALLHGVQAGRSRAARIAVLRGRAAGVPEETMLTALLELEPRVGALERAVVNGYRTAELELARTARDVRFQVLRRLLHGSAEAPPDEDVRRAGLRPDGLYRCLTSNVTDPVRARELELRLSVCGGLFGLVDGRLSGLAPRLPAEIEGDALVVCAPPARLDEARGLHALCGAALGAAEARGLRGLRELTGLAGETALAAQPALAGLLSRTLLGPLEAGDPFHRQLAATALAYLDHERRLDRTAAALHVHPNTVRYRLGRLEEVVGAAPGAEGTVLDTLRWWWALHTWLDG
ncbi:PucR family transcriptional regulator [Actinomadura sp. WMMB 499]|nr:PucR family transcriptional regulator [Actinomadura sp. WMMB 499]